jgi:hypothetical protein
MSKFEIVLALLSFVYALALTHLLQGLSDLIHNRHRVRWSAAHGAWLFLALMTLLNNWLALIPLREAEWGIALTLLAFSISAIQYFTCSLAMPNINNDGIIDLNEFQLKEAKVLFLPYLLMLVPVVGQNFLFRHEFGLSDKGILAFLLLMWPLYLGVAVLALAIWQKGRWLRVIIPSILGLWTLTGMLT